MATDKMLLSFSRQRGRFWHGKSKGAEGRHRGFSLKCDGNSVNTDNKNICLCFTHTKMLSMSFRNDNALNLYDIIMKYSTPQPMTMTDVFIELHYKTCNPW